MPRVIVVPDSGAKAHEKYLDEQVSGVLLEDEHTSLQLIERLAWAIHDAEKAQLEPSGRPLRPSKGYLEVAG